MKNLLFVRRFPKPFGFSLTRYLVICVGLICTSNAFGQGQAGGDTPTGLAGGFGGSITTGGGSFDPYERNATRTVTDIVVPGAVVPFTYTRIWNSRSGWTDNWSWHFDEIIVSESNASDDNLFRGYNVHYADGRVVKFNKPNYGTPMGGPGTYLPGVGIQDRFVIPPDGTQAQLFLTDGSVVNFGIYGDLTSIVDPHGLAVTVTYDGEDMTIQEPGGRTIVIHPPQYSNNNRTITSTVTASRDQNTPPNQTVTYTDWYYTNGYYDYDGNGDPDGDNITTDRGAVTYNDIIDPSTGLAIEAHYVYKWVQSPSLVPNAPLPPDHERLIWASDPMFDGPLQQIKYVYVDNTSAPTGDVYMTGVLEQRWAPNYWDPNAPRYHDPGTLVSRVKMLPWTYSQSDGNSEGYWTRKETRGDGTVRTISYFNPTKVHNRPDGTHGLGQGQTLVDNFTDFAGHSERHEYDWQHYFPTPIKITDARQNVTEQNLDPVLGHITRETHDADASYRTWDYTDPNNPYYVGRKTDERGKPTIYTRDPASHLVTRIDYPDGAFETFSYNGFGQVTQHGMTTGGTETFTYDGRGLKTEYRDPYHATGNPTFRYQYDSKDRLSGVTDALGSYPGDPAYTTNYEYNARNQLTRTIHPTDSATGQRYTIQNVYNMATGTLTSTTDELGHPTSYTYDEYRRVLTVTNPMGKITTNYYGLDWANPLAHTTNNVKYTLSPMNKNVVFDYDANLRKIDQVAALGTADEAWTLFEYDAVGNLTKTTDQRFKETRFGYDARNRKIWMDDPIATDRSSTGHTMNWEYDSVGNKTKETRTDDAFRSWDYDSMNRLSHAIDWRASTSDAPVTTTYARQLPYDLTESITDAKGAVYTSIFDLLHRKTSETYPVDATGQGRTETWHYDAAGNMDQHVNVVGNTNRLEYDNRNRLHKSSWAWNGPTTVTNYDAASRMTDITTSNGTAVVTAVAFGYDDASRKTSEDQTLSGYPTRRVNTPRDADGNRTTLSVDNYYSISYGYTQRNQLSAVNGFAGFTYDASGNMTNRTASWIYLSGTNYYYDDLNRVTQIEHGNGQTFFSTSHYQYDKVSREVATWRDEQSSKGEWYNYSTTNQLTQVRYNADQVWTGSPVNWDRWVDYGYRPDGLNRWYVNDNADFAWVGANALNQYTNIGASVPEYDAQFNLTSYNGVTFTFDAENHLVDGSMQATYDGLGRCVRRTVGGVTRLFTYDDWKPVLEWDGSANWIATNLYGAGSDEILARCDSSGRVLIYKQDQHGNVVAVLDQGGGIVEKYRYDAFGKPTISDWNGNGRTSSAIGNRFMYTGREWIQELGIYDYRHRMYHPGLGRFLQTDPMGLQTEGAKLSAGQKALFSPGGQAPEAFGSSEMNLYRYCGDDPMDKTDPMGLDSLNLYAPGSEDSQAANLRGINPHEVTVGGHGSNRVIVDFRSGTRVELTDKRLAKEIQGLPDYTSKKPVRLYPCNAGQGQNSPAERLSKLIPNPVIASNKDTGETMYQSPKTGKVVKSTTPRPLDGGKWIIYQNGYPIVPHEK